MCSKLIILLVASAITLSCGQAPPGAPPGPPSPITYKQFPNGTCAPCGPPPPPPNGAAPPPPPNGAAPPPPPNGAAPPPPPNGAPLPPKPVNGSALPPPPNGVLPPPPPNGPAPPQQVIPTPDKNGMCTCSPPPPPNGQTPLKAPKAATLPTGQLQSILSLLQTNAQINPAQIQSSIQGLLSQNGQIQNLIAQIPQNMQFQNLISQVPQNGQINQAQIQALISQLSQNSQVQNIIAQLQNNPQLIQSLIQNLSAQNGGSMPSLASILPLLQPKAAALPSSLPTTAQIQSLISQFQTNGQFNSAQIQSTVQSLMSQFPQYTPQIQNAIPQIQNLIAQNQQVQNLISQIQNNGQLNQQQIQSAIQSLISQNSGILPSILPSAPKAAPALANLPIPQAAIDSLMKDPAMLVLIPSIINLQPNSPDFATKVAAFLKQVTPVLNQSQYAPLVTFLKQYKNDILQMTPPQYSAYNNLASNFIDGLKSN
jgi:polyhydroxyalkanoate synthesis regulator phasin